MIESDARRVVTHVVSGDLWAGAEVQVYNLCRALQASNQILPTAVVFNDGILLEKLQELGMFVTLADETQLGPTAIARAIAAHCRKYKTEIVHTHGFKENVLGILGKELARVPASARTVHGNPETPFTLKRPHKWMVQKLDITLGRLRQQAVFAVSTQLEERLERLFPGKVHKIFNFIDVDDIRRQCKKHPETKAKRPRVGIVGRLVPVKRVDIFLEAIALLNQRGLECEGVIIGGGPLEAELKQLGTSLGITDRIEFKGFVSPAAAEMAKLDVLLMPSDHEGLPMTLLEALALEVPIVSHSIGGIPEVLDNGGCGWLVTDHTPEGYARALAQVLTEETDLAEKTESGLKHVRQNFGFEANSIKYMSVYNNI